MSKGYSRYLGAIHFIGDFLILNIAFYIISYKFNIQLFNAETLKYPILLLIFNFNWFVSAFFLQSYDIPRVASNFSISVQVLKLVILHIATSSASIILLFDTLSLDNAYFIQFYIWIISAILVWRLGFNTALHFYRQKGFNYRNIIIVGFDEVSTELLNFFKSKPYFGYRFKGFFDNETTNDEVVGSFDKIESFVFEHDIDEIYCATSKVNKNELDRLVQIADYNLVRLKLIPDLREVIYDKILINHYGRLPIITFRREPLNNYINQIAKRFFDILFSSMVVIFILSWLFPILSLLIIATSKGPVLFFQKRTGKYNKTFWCLKFRTMRQNNESDTRQATPNDERITPIGRILRRTNLDELPQFINVLLGDMSVVGPRPHMLKHTEEFSRMIDKYMVRHLVKPGITGLSQTRGLRGETLTPSHMRNRVKIDIFYIENWSFWLDLKIIFRTVVNMARGDERAF